MKILLLSFLCLASFTVSSQKKDEWRKLFNGKDLTGWKQINGKAKFEVIKGELVGTTVDSDANSFLATEEVFEDFILELDFKMDSTNSGVQVRSESKTEFQNGRVHGYQVDFDPTPRAWSGGIYDEARRNWIYPLRYNPKARTAFKLKEWNHCKIECIGNNIRVWMNGVATAHVIDDMTSRGIIALQVHAIYRKEDIGKQVRFKNIRIKTERLVSAPVEKLFVADLIEAKQLLKENKGFSIVEKPKEKKTEVYYEGKLMTAYTYYDSIFKPAMYPVNTLSGTTVTREFPLQRKPGERADHPHHVGMFFTYESVNGLDFWNMSMAIPPKDRVRYGRIVHTRTACAQGLKDQALLVTTANWRNSKGQTLLEESTMQEFKATKTDLVIDRTTELRAMNGEVLFKDAKDALLGLRVARELELPSNDWKTMFVKEDGTITEQAVINNEGATGNYHSSEGVDGDAVWGKKAKWMMLSGVKEGKKVSIAIIDHPQNMEYPTYWHARGYGLFAANPLGKEVFTNGKEKLNFNLKKNERVTFRYRIIIREGNDFTDAELNNQIATMTF